MKSFEFDFAKRNMLGNKRHFRSVFFVLFFMSLLLGASFCYISSMRHTAEEQLFSSYGAWRYAAVGSTDKENPDIGKLRAREDVTSLGILKLYGKTGDGARLGTADEAALDLGRIQVLEGHLPTAENEIAIESGTLSLLGYSYDLGQSILLSGTDISGENTFEKEFVLSGVLRNFSDLWSSEAQAGCPSAFVSMEWAEGLTNTPRITALMTAKTDLSSSGADIDAATKIIHNEEAYPKGFFGTEGEVFFYLIFLLSAVSLCILIVALVLSVRKRRDLWLSLRRLGADKQRLRKILFFECLCLFAAAVPGGLLLGVGIASGLIFLFGESLGILLFVGVTDVLLPAAIAVFAVLVGTVCALLSLPSVKSGVQVKKAGRRRLYRPLKKLNARIIALRFMRSRLVYSVSIFLLLFAASMVLGVTVQNLSAEYMRHQSATQIFSNADYILESPLGESRPGMDRAVAEQLENVYGVERADGYLVTDAFRDAFTVDLSAYRDSAYAKLMDYSKRGVRATDLLFEALMKQNEVWMGEGLRGNSMKEKQLAWLEDEKHTRWDEVPSTLSDYPVDLMGVDLKAGGLRFLDAPDAGAVDREAFGRGESCVLYLPAVYSVPINEQRYEDGETLPYYQYLGIDKDVFYDAYARGEENPDADKGYDLIDETAVQVGDILRVRFGETEKSIRVDAILRKTAMEDTYHPRLSTPYQIVCANTFLDGFEDYIGQGGYNTITAKAGTMAAYASTDKEISRIAASLNGYTFQNKRLELETIKRDFATDVVMQVLYAVLFCAAVFTVLGVLFSSSLHTNRKRIAVYRAQGLEVKTLKYSYFIEMFILSSGAVLLTLITLAVMWGIREIRIIGTSATFLSYILTTTAEHFLWTPFFIGIFVLLVCVFISYLKPMREFFKENFIDALK